MLKMGPEMELDIDATRPLASNKRKFNCEENELILQEANLLDPAATMIQTSNRGCWKWAKRKQTAIIRVNQIRLGNLLDRLSAAHRWREASAVLSLLFAGNERSYSQLEDRKNFVIAMEIQKRFCNNRNYHNFIKSTYEIWFSKLSWYEKGAHKTLLLQLELVLFYISQGKFVEAHNCTRFLVTDQLASLPILNLIHGLILYQLWYADLPKEMQIKGFDVYTSADVFRMSVIDENHESEICESSNEHDALDIKSTKVFSNYSSESSFGNEKISKEGRYNAPKSVFGDTFSVHDHIGEWLDDEEEQKQPGNSGNSINTSIFFASGLDTILLPIHLKLLTEDPIESILQYRKLANEMYKESEKHLRFALHSSPPLLAALLPLIQLLLLGDRVHEAIVELDKSCNELDSALPFRLKARLLQCLFSSQISKISFCYENSLTRDPACSYSMERLVKMHKTGNYNTSKLLEMLATHLDAVDGKCSIWEEFASCFLKLQTAILNGYCDSSSTNVRGAVESTYNSRILIMFLESETRDTWKLRCKWWVSRHFGRSIYLSEIQAGDWMLLQFKAACAAHLYGSGIEYVNAVLSSYKEHENSMGISYLQNHIKNAMNLTENLICPFRYCYFDMDYAYLHGHL